MTRLQEKTGTRNLRQERDEMAVVFLLQSQARPAALLGFRCPCPPRNVKGSAPYEIII